MPGNYSTSQWQHGCEAMQMVYEYEHKTLIFKLNKAADMLDYVWGKYTEELDKKDD